MADPKTKMAKVILYVKKDLMAETVAFYKDVIGLANLNPINDGWVVFDSGPCRLCLHVKRKPPTDDAPIGRVNLAISVTDAEAVRKLHRHAQDAGLQNIDKIRPEEPGELGELRSRIAPDQQEVHFFWVSDPAGNIVQIESPSD